MAHDLLWLSRRLKAMSLPEVIWRLDQKRLCRRERQHFCGKGIKVTETVFDAELEKLTVHPERLCLNMENDCVSCEDSITLLGGFNYEDFRLDWHAGFRNGSHWPKVFSYDIEYKQRGDIGDVRLNWELNRHAQFVALAKKYQVTGDCSVISELEALFRNWNEENPFLSGISWTSAMEVAIRTSNWCYTYAFLARTKHVSAELLEGLRKGIINMTAYVVEHYSRYSSANNHLIVEAYAIGQSGILLDYQPWINLAMMLLTKELPLQNYSDGVNKELSLHYQAFSMEAMGLMLRLMQKNGMEVPDIWYDMLRKMCRYLVSCMGVHGEVAEFGDNDDGRILKMGQDERYYIRILEMYSFLLPERYVDRSTITECNGWLFSKQERQEMWEKPLFEQHHSCCFKEGGNSILRSEDERILIGIDHAALGYGSIAAHGHADALSFQMFVDGVPVFADPGTYSYHISKDLRDAYRSTRNHNTVCLEGRDQSEMLGAFLWGRKANCKLLLAEFGQEQDIIAAEHDGYLPVKVRRKFCFNRRDVLTIEDDIEGTGKAEITFVLGPAVEIESLEQRRVILTAPNARLFVSSICNAGNLSWSVREVGISSKYAEETSSAALVAQLECSERAEVKTVLRIV